MAKRRIILIAVALIACVATIGAIAVRPGQVGPTWKNYMRIHDGMTFEEAERILGNATTTNEGAEGKRSANATWIARDHSVLVICFRADRSVIKQWFDSDEVTILDRMRRITNLE